MFNTFEAFAMVKGHMDRCQECSEKWDSIQKLMEEISNHINPPMQTQQKD